MSQYTRREDVLAEGATIDWKKYARAGSSSKENILLESIDVQNLEKFSGDETAMIAELLTYKDTDAEQYAKSLTKVMTNIRDIHVLRFILTVVEDIFEDSPSETAVRENESSRLPIEAFVDDSGNFPTKELISVLRNTSDAYLMRQCARIAAWMVVYAEDHQHSSDDQLNSLLSWVVNGLREWPKHSDTGKLLSHADVSTQAGTQKSRAEAAVFALMVLLRNPKARNMFVQINGVQCLPALLNAPTAQTLYETTFCLWTLSFEQEGRLVMYRTDVISELCDISRPTDQPLKVVRMSVATLANLCKEYHNDIETVPNPQDFAEPFLRIWETSFPSVLELIRTTPKFDDDELLKDVEFLVEELQKQRGRITSIERYRAQLNTGKFTWNFVHSPEFWREHLCSFEENDFELLRKLKTLISSASVDSVTLAIACSDVGHFAMFHPQGKTISQALGLKDVIMNLLAQEDTQVRQQALLTLSKLMVQKWQFVAPQKHSTKAHRSYSEEFE